MTETELSKDPTPDEAEDNAFFPSPYSLSQATSPKTDFDNVDHQDAYRGGRWKVLMIAADERYVLTTNGTMFSTGNHPVEMLLPLHHMLAAGFDVEVATVSGNPAKLEFWAMPREDDTVMGTYDRIKPKLKAPKKLSEVVQTELGEDSDYLAVFIPGGHGPLIGIPESPDVAKVLNWALDTDRFIITLCHGPAGLLAAGIGQEKSPLAGYSTCVFPDALDKGPNQDMGYLPGPLPWALGERLAAQGLNVLNTEMTGQVHRDRQLLSGDSPLAANALGHLAADVLVEAVANR